jgi:hypothetical protein
MIKINNLNIRKKLKIELMVLMTSSGSINFREFLFEIIVTHCYRRGMRSKRSRSNGWTFTIEILDFWVFKPIEFFPEKKNHNKY